MILKLNIKLYSGRKSLFLMNMYTFNTRNFQCFENEPIKRVFFCNFVQRHLNATKTTHFIEK